MLVLVDPLGQAEVLAVERGGSLSILDRQGNVVERHRPILAFRFPAVVGFSAERA